MPSTQSTAREISEDLLCRTGQALMNGDFAQFMQCFALPQEMDTLDGRRMISSEQGMQEMFDGVRAYFSEKGVTELARVCVEASFLSPDTIATTHKSRLLNGVTLIQDPYPAYAIVKQMGAQWKITFSQYAILDEPEHNQALMSAGDKTDQ